MRRTFAHDAEVRRRADEAAAEMVQPDAVHQHSRDERVRAAGQPSCKGDPASARRQVGIFLWQRDGLAGRREHAQPTGRDGVLGLLRIAAMGFLRVNGPNELMFADHGGNRQMISVGSLSVNDRVNLFLMDYPARERLKILGHARVLDAREHPEIVAKIAPPGGHAAKVERIFVIDVLSYDWNCPKFITSHFTVAEIENTIEPLKARIAELEDQLRLLTP